MGIQSGGLALVVNTKEQVCPGFACTSGGYKG